MHYWDTCNFISILKRDDPHYKKCIETIQEAEEERIKIVTSAITLAGVVKIGGKRQPAFLESDESKLIETFFKNEYIIFRDFDRKTAEMSREISWRYKLKGFDAMHVATAIRAKVDFFETTDAFIIKKMSNQLNDPTIIFREPILYNRGEQLTIFDT